MQTPGMDIAYESPQGALGSGPTTIVKGLAITCTEKVGKTGKLADCAGREVAPMPT